MYIYISHAIEMIPKENDALPRKMRSEENALVLAQIGDARSMTRGGRIFIAKLCNATSRRPQISSTIKRSMRKISGESTCLVRSRKKF